MAKQKHITEPDHGGYQVRIIRQGKEHSRYFSHNLWGNKEKSLQAAINWREQMLVILASKTVDHMAKTSLSNKTTIGVRGVSRCVQYDKKRQSRYLVYSAYWKQDGKMRHKTFQVGKVDEITADQELHAFRTAIQFRKEYEWCLNTLREFDWQRYKIWRTRRLYEYSS